MKILSLIIPAYNSERFLDRCISSFLNPEVLDKLDIIIVNDGSTDGTVKLAEKYCEMYPDSIRLISQPNKGHGGALNTGYVAAQGKYVKAVDADDWVLTENLPAFVQALEHCDSDVVLTHHHTIDISTGEIKNWRSYPETFGKAYTFQQIMSDWRSFYRSLTFHGITYRRVFYQKYDQPLLEKVFYEDYQYATFPCCYAENVTCFDLFVYEYRIGDVNQSVSNGSRLKRLGHAEAVIRKMTEQYLSLPACDGKRYAARKTHEMILSYLTTVLLVEPDRKKGRALASEMMKMCKTNTPEIFSLIQKKYWVFWMMNRLHVNKSTWEQMLHSRIYNTIRGNHDFE